jgi:hypothetical protein
MKSIDFLIFALHPTSPYGKNNGYETGSRKPLVI